MTCASCVATIEKYVKKLDGIFLYNHSGHFVSINVIGKFFSGVEDILVALMAAKAEVDFDASKILPNTVSSSELLIY